MTLDEKITKIEKIRRTRKKNIKIRRFFVSLKVEGTACMVFFLTKTQTESEGRTEIPMRDVII